MITLVIQCQIGRSASEKISQTQEAFFQWLASVAFNNISSDDFIFPQTLPISNDRIQNQPGKTYDDVATHLAQVFDELSFKKSLGLLIFDIDIRSYGQLRARAYQMILRAIEDWLGGLDTSPSMILLVDNIPHQADVVFDNICKISEKVKLIVIDEDGNSFPDTGIPKIEFCKRLIKAKSNPRLAISKKMVRQLGHFQKDKGAKRLCIRHFYDGQYCATDIANLLFVLLADEMDSSDTICYHSKRSPWVQTSVMELQNKINCNIFDFALSNDTETLGQYYLVLDFVDTGTTVIDAVAKLKRDPKRIISILAKRSNGDNGNVKILSRGDSTPLEVEYLIEAEYSRLGFENFDCPLCKIGMPIDALGELSTLGMLRALDFWEMVLDGCSDQELDPPLHREPNDPVVNLSQALNKYGAFIASKVRQLIDDKGFSLDCVLVFPQGETVAAQFAMHLFYLSNENHLMLPREAIEDSIAGNFDHSKYSHHDWYINLQSDTIEDCIVVDDILITGKSMFGMGNIIAELGKNVVAYIPIVQLGSSRVSLLKDNVYPLYFIDC